MSRGGCRAAALRAPLHTFHPAARTELLRTAAPPLPAAPHQRQAGLAPSSPADTIPRPPSRLASSPRPLPGGWGLDGVSLTPQCSEPRQPLQGAPGKPGHKTAAALQPSPRRALEEREQRLEDRSAASHPGPRRPAPAAGPPSAGARRSLRAQILPPTPRPPAPQPLDCGRRKPLHERAPERAPPAGPAAAQILAPGAGAGAGALSLQQLRRPAPRSRPGRLPGSGGGDRGGRGRGLPARSCLIMVYFLPERLL